MQEVSSLIAAPLWDYLTRCGVDVSALRRQQQTRRALFGVERMDWESFSQLCTLAAAHDQDGMPLRDALDAGLDALPFGQALHLLGWTLTPQQLYTRSVRWLIPSLLPAVTITARALPDERVEIIAGLVEGAQPCQAFFAQLAQLWRALPRLLSLPDALVDVETTARQGRYIITPPPAHRLPRRLFTAQDSLRRSWSIATHLHTQLTHTRGELGHIRAIKDEAAHSELALRAALLQHERDAAGTRDALTRLEAQAQAARDALAQQVEEAEQADASARVHAQASNTLRRDVETLRAQLAEATANAKNSAAERDKLAEELRVVRRDIQHITQDREGFERLASETKAHLDRERAKLSELDARYRLAENTLRVTREEAQAQRLAHDALEAQLQQAQRQLDAQQQGEANALGALQTQLASALAEVDALRAQHTTLTDQRDQAREDATRAAHLATLLLADARAELRPPIEQLQQLGRSLVEPGSQPLATQLQRLAGELRMRISHLFDLERIYTDTLTLDAPQTLGATQLLDELSSVLTPETSARENSLTLEATRGVQELTLDVPKLRKALHHLLLNANALSSGGALRLKLSRDRRPGTRFELRYPGEAMPLERWRTTLARAEEDETLPGAVRHTIADAMITTLGGALTLKESAEGEQAISFVVPDIES